MVNLDKLGKALVREVKKQILLMDLVDTGDLLESINYKITSKGLVLFSMVPYAEELEYGTFALKSGSDSDFLSTAAQAKSLKKKDMPSKMRVELPKGMVPFAMFRRVLYNEELMSSLVKKSM